MHKKKRVKEVKGIKIPQSGTASQPMFYSRHHHHHVWTGSGPHDRLTLLPAIPNTSLTPTVHDVPAAI